MAEPMFRLKSRNGNFLAIRKGALALLPGEDTRATEFLTVTGTQALHGLSASHLVTSTAAKQALASLFLIKGAKPGTAALLNDQSFLGVTEHGSLTLRSLQFAPLESFELIEQAANHAARRTKPAIWIKPIGNVGNRALGYLVAERIRQLVPDAEIQNISLPEWGLDRASVEPPPATAVRTGGWDRFWIDIHGFADCLRRGVMDTLIIDSCCFRIDHYPTRAECRKLLGPMKNGALATGFASDQLVCSVRANEILDAKHPWYFTLPAGYYKLLAELTGLELVFYGQIGDDFYSDSLRAAFPQAKFIAGHSPGYDFEVLRKSKNIALSISTFAWLAAWLSEASCVYVPLGGIFNPILHGNQNFLPVDDPAFRYIMLPFVKPVSPLSDRSMFIAQQSSIEASMRTINTDEIHQIIERAKLMRPYQPYVGGFDATFYKTKMEQNVNENPLNHFVRQGYRDGKLPAHVDSEFYLRSYPDVAMTIAMGKYSSPVHHYAAEGWRQRYSPAP